MDGEVGGDHDHQRTGKDRLFQLVGRLGRGEGGCRPGRRARRPSPLDNALPLAAVKRQVLKHDGDVDLVQHGVKAVAVMAQHGALQSPPRLGPARTNSSTRTGCCSLAPRASAGNITSSCSTRDSA